MVEQQSSITEIIDRLWQEKRVEIKVSDEETLVASLRIITDGDDCPIYDVQLSNGVPVGFITLYFEGNHYQIINYPAVLEHRGFSNRLGIGIEVNRRYQRRNIGFALLSLGIGIVQKAYNENKAMGEFKVIASGLGNQAYSFWEKYGFRVEPSVGSHAYFENPSFVRPLNIKPN